MEVGTPHSPQTLGGIFFPQRACQYVWFESIAPSVKSAHKGIRLYGVPMFLDLVHETPPKKKPAVAEVAVTGRCSTGELLYLIFSCIVSRSFGCTSPVSYVSGASKSRGKSFCSHHFALVFLVFSLPNSQQVMIDAHNPAGPSTSEPSPKIFLS